ncbi:MAG: hypothetical protein V9E98_11075 [Candidatus Nanopelagicales bacterium]
MRRRGSAGSRDARCDAGALRGRQVRVRVAPGFFAVIVAWIVRWVPDRFPPILGEKYRARKRTTSITRTARETPSVHQMGMPAKR